MALIEATNISYSARPTICRYQEILMRQQLAHPILLIVNWLGGWVRFILLLIVVVGVAFGLLWERQGGVPLPPQAQG